MEVVIQAQVGDALTLRSSEIEFLEVVQELGEHTRCLLTFSRDKDTDRQLDAMLGEPLTITLTAKSPVDDEAPTVAEVFNGFVAAGSQSHRVNHGSGFRLEGVSFSALLDRQATQFFPESLAADVFGKLGLAVRGALGGGRKLEFTQFGETDFQFCKRLADENGMFLRTTGEQVEVCKGFQADGPTLRWGNDLLAVTANCQPVNPGFGGAVVDESGKADHRFRGILGGASWIGGAAPMTAAVQKVAAKLHKERGDGSVRELPWRSVKPADARSYLTRESARALGAAVLIDCSGNNVAVKAGDYVTLEGSEAFELPTRGKLGVVRVAHQFDGHLYSNEFTATPWASWSNVAMPERQLASGTTTGLVTDNNDPEKRGRVQVRMRWQDNGEATRWLRLMMPHTGNDRGMQFVPEIGDEVVIAFEMGDPERPLVLGSVWNGQDKPLTDPDNDLKRIVTRSGNTINLYDGPAGNERIEIYSSEGHCWVQLHNNGGKPLITIHSEGDISLEAKEEIRLSCRSLVERVDGKAARIIKGDHTLDVSGNQKQKIGGNLNTEAGANITTKAGAMLDAQAGAIHSIVGSMVHIQPPGKQVPAVTITNPSKPSSPYAAGTKPTVKAPKTSQDRKNR